jgi:hypothetical protein
MSKEKTSEEIIHDLFVKKICETGTVWGLENDNGFAMSSSADYEDASGEPLESICFWSDITLAKVCLKDEWAGYSTAKIELGDFLEHWCVGMANDGLVIGIDFDQNLIGYEIDPLLLVIDVYQELKNQGKEITLTDYLDLDELVKEIDSVKSEEFEE